MKKSNRFSKVSKYSFILISVLAVLFYFGVAYPFRGTFFNVQRHGNPPLTPALALGCWLWEDDSNTAINGIEGIEMAIENIMKSAKVGYNIIGSDVAGFSGKVIPPRLYIRWAQFSTFCGLFLNGGHGERALWKRTQQKLEIIRNFLVAPLYKDELVNEVNLPKGKWRYFFDDKEVIDSKERINISLSGIQKPHILNINLEKTLRKVELDSVALSDAVNYFFNGSTKKLVVRTAEYSKGNCTIFK